MKLFSQRFCDCLYKKNKGNLSLCFYTHNFANNIIKHLHCCMILNFGCVESNLIYKSQKFPFINIHSIHSSSRKFNQFFSSIYFAMSFNQSLFVIFSSFPSSVLPFLYFAEIYNNIHVHALHYSKNLKERRVWVLRNHHLRSCVVIYFARGGQFFYQLCSLFRSFIIFGDNCILLFPCDKKSISNCIYCH